MNIRKLLVLIIALLALVIIAWDYTSAHTLEQLVDPGFYCAICDAFHAALAGVILLYILILLGLIPALHILGPASAAEYALSFDPSVRSNRAPPATT